MNYIKKLQMLTKAYAKKLVSANTWRMEMIGYLTSDKFNCGDELDHYVNVQDMLNWLHELNNILNPEV